MDKSNKRRAELLGEPFGTAMGKLRKSLLFALAARLKLLNCFRCGLLIRSVKEFSIEHKISWLLADDPKSMFFDPNNIAFSHLSCNISAAYKPNKKYVNLQEKHREKARRRYADPVRYEEFLAYKRSRYSASKNK